MYYLTCFMVLLSFSVDNTQTVVVHVFPLTCKSKCETRVVQCTCNPLFKDLGRFLMTSVSFKANKDG